MTEQHRIAGQARARQFTPEYQAAAGKASYAARVRHFLELHGDNYDRAAQALTGFRRARGLRYSAGLTGRYMREWAERLGLAREEDTESEVANG